jgi:hypothetical protein
MNDATNGAFVDDLLRNGPVVVNIGLSFFAEDLRRQGVLVTDVDWTPPAGGDPRLADLLSKLGI